MYEGENLSKGRKGSTKSGPFFRKRNAAQVAASERGSTACFRDRVGRSMGGGQASVETQLETKSQEGEPDGLEDKKNVPKEKLVKVKLGQRSPPFIYQRGNCRKLWRTKKVVLNL